MSTTAHRAEAKGTPVRCAVITVSDTRTVAEDSSGSFIQKVLTDAGFSIVHYEIIPDDLDRVAEALDAGADVAEAVLFNGGTGITARDLTVDVISEKLDKELSGFGELFRMLSYEEVGAASMLSRATAGVYRGTLVFSMPGSTNAVQLAMEKLILPELEHLVWEVARQG